MDFHGFELKFTQNLNPEYSMKIGTYEGGSLQVLSKYSKKLTTPWRFSFTKLHQDELKIMSELCKNCYLLLVCNKDGIACISYKDLKKILDDNHEVVEWISASRLARESYAIKGSDGKLKFKINLNDFPKNVTKNL